MVELAAGDPQSATIRLRDLRDRFDRLPECSATREVASLLTDDSVRTFRPAGYEEVMLRTMLALCSLATDGVDAESYALQATRKQSELARRAEQRGIAGAAEIYQPVAVAPYIRGMLREATHHDYDDAERAYRLVSSIRPDFAPAAADISRAGGGVHSPPGHGVLYVIGLVGRGPVLAETEAEATSAALSIASSILNAETNQGSKGKPDFVLPNIASVKVPHVVIPPPSIVAVGVRIDGRLRGATQTLTDVGELARRQVEAEMPWTIARAAARRVTKEAAVAKTTETLGLTGTAGSLFHFAAASSWSATEQADTRCWGLLPREIQVFRSELPAGSHQVSLQPIPLRDSTAASKQTMQVEIANAENHYLIAFSCGQSVHVVRNEQ